MEKAEIRELMVQDSIHHTTTTRLKLRDRLKALLGGKIKIYSIIDVDKQVNILDSKVVKDYVTWQE